MASPDDPEGKARYLNLLLRHPTALRAGGASPSAGPEVVASYYMPDGARPFAFCRKGLLVDPDGSARFVPFDDIEDSGYYDGEALRQGKDMVRAGEVLREGLSLSLVGGEQIELPLVPRADKVSERLTIAGLVERYARYARIDRAKPQT